MSFVSSLVPIAAAPIISAQPQSVRSENAQSAQILTQASNLTQPSSDAKTRSVSSGQNKQVDSTFNSEKYNGGKGSKNSSSGSKSSINVVA
jgi:hypothetical protein